MKRRFWPLLAWAISAWVSPLWAQAPQFEIASTPRSWSFPRDHASHPDYSTEWWYFTGSVFDTHSRRYGYELTFFRVGLRPDLPEGSEWRARDLIVAHLTFTEVEWERFHQAERMQRAAAGLAQARSDRLELWIGDWSVTYQAGGTFRLKASHEDFGLDLELRPTRPPILHGDQGLSWKDADRTMASHYLSQPRMQTTGGITLGGLRRPVSGSTWMDHEFFTGPTPREGLGWDWFSVRLSDGRDLMVYRVRQDGRESAVFGTVVEPDGQSRPLVTEGLRLTPTRWWSSPRTRIRYPIEWTIDVPAEELRLSVHPTLDEQEVDARRTVGFRYWEGLCDYDIRWKGQDLIGEGYVELTGYDRLTMSQP